MTVSRVLTSLLLALLCFHKYVWKRKEKQKESAASVQCLNKEEVFDSPKMHRSHPEPPPLSTHPWCIWSRCMRQSAWDPELTHISRATSLVITWQSNTHFVSPRLTMSASSFQSGCGKTIKHCESCKGHTCGRIFFFFSFFLSVSPFPPLSPTGPTQHSELQPWPGGSLPSLGPAGPDMSLKSYLKSTSVALKKILHQNMHWWIDEKLLRQFKLY